jgi:hypothetical protein
MESALAFSFFAISSAEGPQATRPDTTAALSNRESFFIVIYILAAQIYKYFLAK